MGHDAAGGDWGGLREAAPGREFLQIALQGLVDVQLALLHQLHGSGGGEQLGNRADPVDRLRCGRPLVGQIGKAETFRPDHPLVVHQGDRKAGHVISFHLLADQPGDVLPGVGVIVARHCFRLWRHGGTAGQHKQQ